MLSRRLVNSIATFAVVTLCLPFSAQAQRSSSVPTNNHFQNFLMNPSSPAMNGVMDELLGANVPERQWPAFPRYWHQIEDSHTNDTMASVGATLSAAGIVSIGGKATFSYTYGQKTTLVVMASLRPRSAATQNTAAEMRPPRNPEERREMFRRDSATGKRYYNVSQDPKTDDHPMVGFCVYEMSLKLSRAIESTMGASAVVSTSLSASNTVYRAETMMLYSNFFQIEHHVSVEDYMTVKCGEHFQKPARELVEADFNKIVLEYYNLYHPGNNCRIGGQITDDGDVNCLAWFKQQHPGRSSKTLVPRCEVVSGGMSRCVLKSKKGFGCPMYMDRRGQYTEDFNRYNSAVRASNAAFTCDKGLSCAMDSEAWALNGIVIWPGTSSCK